MPEFSRKPYPLAGPMDWNHSLDSIPEGRMLYGRNVRNYQSGVTTSRPGLTAFTTLSGRSFIHSQSRLNGNPAVTFDFTYVIGADGFLYIGANNAQLTNGALNPVDLPPSGTQNALSGNPLTMVDMAPESGFHGWKYIGDSNMNVKAGYYPGDNPASDMGRALTMGMTPPVWFPTITQIAAGNLNGDYQWIVAFRNIFTNERSNPSAASRETLATPATTLAAEDAQFTLPSAPIDPQTGAADTNIVCDIYRFGGTIFRWALVGTSTAGTTFTDALPDSAILTAPSPPSFTDPVTGISRFNLFRPFVAPDLARFGTGTLSQAANNVWLFTQVSGDTFNLNWLPGSIIGINGGIFTIYQVRTSTVIELAEDASSANSGPGVAWSTPAGTLKAGTPLKHIWGPYGTGQTGAYIFGCGDPNSSGTLYWTNGNDPDSTDLANSLVLTSPSEPLRGGVVYDGTCLVWSTERMFRVYPNLTVPGQFSAEEIPGGKGLWMEYSLSVQSNSIADISVSWRGKDGVYEWGNQFGLRSLTSDSLYPYFPHDNQPGLGLRDIFDTNPDLALLGSPDDTGPQYQRTTWFQGLLFYDYRTNAFGFGSILFATLVYDPIIAKGWVSVDTYDGITGGRATSRMVEIAANRMKIALENTIYEYEGDDDDGDFIVCDLITPQDTQGDWRGQKLYGDAMVDLDPGGSGAVAGVIVAPWVDYATQPLAGTAYTTGPRNRNVLGIGTPSPSALGYLSYSLGLSVSWTASGDPVYLYGYELSWVPKPPITTLRATDRTDDGYLGPKYLRGVVIESNTFGAAKPFQIFIDGSSAASLQTPPADGQLESPYALSSPRIGHEFQIVPTGSTPWEIFSVRWIWDKYADLAQIRSPWMDLGTPKPKYIRGFEIPLDSNGLGISMSYVADSQLAFTAIAPDILSTLAGIKTSIQFSFPAPVCIRQIQLRPNIDTRCWWDEIKWDAEEWPEITIETYPFQDLGDPRAKYLRRLIVPVENNNLPGILRLTSDAGANLSLAVPNTQALYKTAFPLVPPAPIIAHEFQLRSLTAMRVWWQEIAWEFEVWPELDTGRSKFSDLGYPGAKFIQGFVAPVDTNGASLNLNVLYTAGVQSSSLASSAQATLVTGPFVSTPAGVKSPIPYSFPTPFIAHEIQLAPSASCRVWEDEVKWIWEPVPELVTTYSTQQTNHDLPGWHSLYDAYIAYIGSADAPLLTIESEYSTLQYILPISNGAYTRAYLRLNPQKSKYRSYSIVSTGGVRLFKKDCEVRAKAWSSDAAWVSFQPFGEDSRTSGARI